VKLRENQRLVLSLVTTFDGLSAPATSDSEDYNADFDDLSITSHDWSKFILESDSEASIQLSYAINESYWVVSRVQVAARALSDSYPSLADYNNTSFTITPGTHLKIKLVVTAAIGNSSFADITQTAESEVDFVWVLPPVVTLTSVTHSYSPSTSIVNFSVNPRGGTVTSALIVAIPADDTELITAVSTIVFTQTLTLTVEGPLTQEVQYNVFSNLMNNMEEVAILISASNAAGLGYFQQNLCTY
jgi:hypothetical protein